MTSPLRTVCGAVLALASLAAFAPVGHAAARAQEILPGDYPEQSGEAIYRGVCQGCHMPDAKGAVGAGAYPALARDRALQNGPYVAAIVISGERAMPPFGPALTDAQIANVVNHVRSNFGNRYGDPMTAAQVRALRPKVPAE